MEPSFHYTIPWRDAYEIHRQLDDRYIPHMIKSLPSGEVTIIFPDLPPKFYAVVREIDATRKRFKLVSDWDSQWINVEDLVSVVK